MALVIIGISLSLYLIYFHYESRAGLPSWCNLNDKINCTNTVLSSYSEIEKIPLGAFGVVWFSVSGLLYHNKLKFSKNASTNAPFYLFVWAGIGVASVAYLVYAELFLVGSVCLLCTATHAAGIAIFVLSYLSVRGNLSRYVKNIFYEQTGPKSDLDE
ncbi:MAG: vitamin K epoxide reductase family protein [Nitrosotalea sp.]